MYYNCDSCGLYIDNDDSAFCDDCQSRQHKHMSKKERERILDDMSELREEIA